MAACERCHDTGILEAGHPISIRCDCVEGKKRIPKESQCQCERCQDTGWIRKSVDGVSFVEECSCRRDRRDAVLIERAQIPPKYARCTVEDFYFDQHEDPNVRSHLRQIVFSVRTFVRKFPAKSDPKGLLLWGANGVGKTHLAAAVLRSILEAKLGLDVRYINYQALLRMIKASYDQPFGSTERNAEYDAIEQVDVLLLDDLGSNRVTDWVEDTITDLIAQRYDNSRPTIVTTNYSPVKPREGTEDPLYLGGRIGERATSRLRDMCWAVGFPSVPDYRGKR